MRMTLQNYSLDIRYKKGRLMFIADALSRSYRLTTDDAQHDSGEVCGLREVHHTDGLSVSPKRLEESKLRTAQDPEMQLLTCQIQKGGPSSRTIPWKLKRANWRKRAGLSWPTLSHSTLAAHWYAEKKNANISEWTDAYEEPESKRFRFPMQHLSIISARTV